MPPVLPSRTLRPRPSPPAGSSSTAAGGRPPAQDALPPARADAFDPPGELAAPPSLPGAPLATSEPAGPAARLGANAAFRRGALEEQVPPSPAGRGRKSPPAPEVAKALAHYGVHERLGRPRERVATWVARIHAQCEAGATTPQGQAEQLLAGDVRLTVFYLEGLLKLYRREYPALGSAFADVKALEDALGQASGARSALALLQDCPGVPAAARAWLQADADTKMAALVARVAADWMPDEQGRLPALARLVDTLAASEWQGYGKDRKTLVDELDRRLKKLEKADLDMGVLQGDTGVHELRRQLRWLPIYAVALDGVFTFAEERHPVRAYEPLLHDEVARSPYARLPSSEREDDPQPISRSLYLRNTQLISELGALKDEGERIEALAFALQGAGLAGDLHAATRDAQALLGLPPDAEATVFARAQAVYDEMRRVGFVRAWREELRGR